MDTALVMYYIRLFAPFSHNINFSKIQQFRSFLKLKSLAKGVRVTVCFATCQDSVSLCLSYCT